ncbi:MAG TPA: flavodoxin [Geobacteraceae bacterium]|nr:flavodoxin [Geobacteraceae bacterium]
MSTEGKNTTSSRAKVLTIYFSRSGNTREIANQIHQMVGGDIMEIQIVTPYPDDYNAVVKQANVELNSGYKPPLKTKIEDIGSYDVIFLGSPNWCQTIAPPVRSFLSQADLSGKFIAPFITHGGGGSGRSVADIAALCRDSTILDALVVRGGKPGKKAITELLSKLEVRG